VNVAKAQEAGATADAQALGLMLSGEVARVYFALRSIDEEKQVLSDTLKLRKEALDLATARVEAGATNELDRVRAEAELAGTEAEIASLTGPRTELENSLALVLGRVASSYKVPVQKLPVTLPTIPKVVPAELVQRRPDVAAAARRVTAANLEVGVARAAWFPQVSLGAVGGAQSSAVSMLSSTASRVWSLGANVDWPLFEAGRIKSGVDAAKARWEAAGADYRDVVLRAMGEVEDALSGLAVLAQQSAAQQTTVDSATRTVDLAQKRYDAGLVPFFEVLDAQRSLLRAEQELNRIQGERFAAAVILVKALGGSWESS
jgi:multidrug efflux system outer membrane protein